MAEMGESIKVKSVVDSKVKPAVVDYVHRTGRWFTATVYARCGSWHETFWNDKNVQIYGMSPKKPRK